MHHAKSAAGCCQEGECCGHCESCDNRTLACPGGISSSLDVGKFFLLTALTGGIYLVYWFYRNWKHIKEYEQSTIHPARRAVGAIFPVLDIIFFCIQLKTIHGLAKKQGARSFPLVWTCIGISVLFIASWTIVISSFFSYPSEQVGLFVLSFLGSIFAGLVLMPVQLTLNDFWNRAHPARATVRASYTNGEKAWLVVGILIMLMDLLAIFAMPSPLDYYPEDYGDYEGIEDYSQYEAPSLEEPTAAPEQTAPKEQTEPQPQQEPNS